MRKKQIESTKNVAKVIGMKKRSQKNTKDIGVNVLRRLIHIHPMIVTLQKKSATKRDEGTIALTIVIADVGREREDVKDHREGNVWLESSLLTSHHARALILGHQAYSFNPKSLAQ